MRIANSMLTANFLNNLNRNLEKMVKQQTQIATGKRITRLSDDPMGTVQSMNTRVRINRIEQYKRNIDSAQSWIGQSESAILELNEVVKSAYENAVSSSNDYLTASDKASAAELIGQLKEHVVTVANAKSGDKFIFSGFNSESLPMQIDSGTGAIMYNGIDMSNAMDPALIAEGSQIIEYEIAYNITSKISISGTELLGTGDENIYIILDEYY
ncbi:MAG: flagellar hook-associated protein FlgL, partial [Clostridiales bacterium]|nr:flagellar hook-associated protein FlgL [Clostridiales bacterium]